MPGVSPPDHLRASRLVLALSVGLTAASMLSWGILCAWLYGSGRAMSGVVAVAGATTLATWVALVILDGSRE